VDVQENVGRRVRDPDAIRCAPEADDVRVNEALGRMICTLGRRQPRRRRNSDRIR
jgi:hypothetical protein